MNAPSPGQPAAAAMPAVPPVAPGPQKLSLILSEPSSRRALLLKLQTLRGSRVIVYVTADRPDLGAQMGDDVVPIFFEHLQALGHQKRLDLFLYTRGGYTLAPTRLAYLIREHCDEFGVLIPRLAHSAGTTLAMAANQIVMHRMGELGPIDPTVFNEFNPEDPTDPDKKRRIAIAVEDVTAYLSLARNQAKVPEEQMASVFEVLTRTVHPLALGNIHRQYLLIRTMGARLLATHMHPEKDKERIEKILDVLTEKLYFHAYPISRAEARDAVGLNVAFADGELEATMWELFSAYNEQMKLGQPALPVDPSSVTRASPLEVEAAVIESEVSLHTFLYEGTMAPRPAQGKTPAGINVQARGRWRKRA